MINWFKKTLGIKPDESNFVAHFYYQNEFVRDQLSPNGFKITRIEPVEILIYLNVFHTNAAQVEIKSLHSSKRLDLIKLPVASANSTVFHLKNEKYDDITLTISENDAILEFNELNFGSIFSKIPIENEEVAQKKESSKPYEDIPQYESRKDDIIIFKTTEKIDVEKKFKNSKYGIIISDSNEWIVPAIYDQMSLEYPDYYEKRYTPKDQIDIPYFSAWSDDKSKIDQFFFLRLNNKTLLLKVDSLLGLSTNWGDFYQFKVANKIGYIDSNGELILETESDENADFNNSNSSLVTWNKIDGNYELLHLIQKKKIPFELNKKVKILYAFQEDYTVIESNGKLGLINLLGDITVPCEFEEIWDIINQKAIAKLNLKYGIISVLNKKITDFKYDDIVYVEKIEGYLININEKYGLITSEGSEILPAQYDEISQIHSTKNVYRVKEGEKIRFATSNKISRLFYDDTLAYFGYTKFSEGLLRVKRNGKIGYINEALDEIIPCVYNEGSVVKDGKILVMIDKSLRFINITGKIIDYNPELAMKYTFENDERLRSFIL
jgi:hypothetical protein